MPAAPGREALRRLLPCSAYEKDSCVGQRVLTHFSLPKPLRLCNPATNVSLFRSVEMVFNFR